MPADKTFIIVGAGLAGAKAAEGLRHEGFGGRLVLIGEEPDRPYERPPLSKDYLRKETDDKPYVHPESFYDDHGIELMTSTRVTEIDTDSKKLVLNDEESIGYDRLLITTGAAPRHLDVPGSDLDGIHYLRTVADSEQIAGRLRPGARLVMVGSGWIGSEIAASARQKGCEVTLLEMGALPLENVLGTEIAQIFLQLHRDNGVEFLAETVVESFGGNGSVERVELSNGAIVKSDFVVVGIGVTPRTEPFAAAGLTIDNGIVVNEHLRTTVDDVFAAGDVANASNPFYRGRIRVEHWANASDQGLIAARSMMGKPATYAEIPYFFSDQYDVGIEYSGYTTDWDEVVFRGDPDSREFLAFWLEDGRVVAGMNMNIWDVHDEIRELIRSRRQVSRADLADAEIPLSRPLQAQPVDAEPPVALGAWASEGGAV
jgi:3-phenylpropionate/trans-cinnamate dioxygenase ferredoxin reductase component